MGFILSISPDQYTDKIIETAGFVETLGFGAMILAIGMLTVFTVLAVLWGALLLFKMAFHDLPNKRKAKVVEEISTTVEEVVPQTSTEEEIIAVLTAAIAAYESESGNIKFRVVSFRRK